MTIASACSDQILTATSTPKFTNVTSLLTVTATAGATTTLTAASTEGQVFTGVTTQTVVLPVTSTLALGWGYDIINQSSGNVTVQSSGTNTIQVMAPGSSMKLRCVSLSATDASGWAALYIIAADVSGAVLLNPAGAQTIATFGLTVPTLNTTNLAFDVTANTIASTNTNGNINITPTGTGGVFVGSSTGVLGNPFSGQAVLQLAKNSSTSRIYLGNYINSSSSGFLGQFKSRSTTIGSFVAVQSGDSIGSYNFYGDDGAALQQTAGISCTVAAAVSSGIVPGQLIFQTANTSGALTTGMTLTDAQILTLAHPLPAGSGGTGITSLGTGVATALGQNVTGSGGIVLAASPTITTPVINAIYDSSGNNIVSFLSDASAVNYLTLSSADASASPVLGSLGSDTNVNIRYLPKAAGIHNFLSTSSSPFVWQTGTGYQHTTTFTFPNTAASQTFTFPDATGTIALTGSASSGYLLTAPSGAQSFTNSLTATNNNIYVAGGNAFVALSPTTNKGQIVINANDNAANYSITFSNASFGQSTAITIPDPGSSTSKLLLSGLAINSVPSITFSSTSGIIGTTTNDNAAAGSVGEYVSSQILLGSHVSYTTSTVAQNLTSISLTAGDYDIEGNIVWDGAGATQVAQLAGWISVISATFPDTSLTSGITYGVTTFSPFVAGAYIGFTVPKVRVSISTTTTIYISAYAAFGVSTLNMSGGIYARRIR